MKKTFALIWAMVFAITLSVSPAFADTVYSPQDSLSADGPYILYGSGGVKVIDVDVQGNISIRYSAKLPEGFTFQVTDHRGKYPFEVTLRPFSRPEWRQPDIPERTFVMSDPHGKLDCVVDLLQGNQVIDSNLDWSFGDGRLVVIGDIADRGKDVTAIYWLFYKLQQEAADAGGSVVMIMGNHETMEAAGDMRYAEPKYKILSRLLSMEYKDMIGPDSELGRWIASWNTVSILGQDLYVHAGLGKEFYDWNLPVPEVNAKISDALFMPNRDRRAQNDTLDFLYGTYGPIWFRGLVLKGVNRHPVSSDTVDLIRGRYGVEHIIVGHTIFRSVRSFMGGRVIDVNVDNAVNRKKGRSRALLIENGTYYTVTDKGKRKRLPSPPSIR